MVFPKARLAVSAGLFLAWIGFLLYLVVSTRDMVVLSRPQLEVSSAVIIADIKEQNGRPVADVTVKKVAKNVGKEAILAEGTLINIVGLADCGPRQGWHGPGDYIIPLTQRGNAYEVTPIPLSPGYYPEFVTVSLVQIGTRKEKVIELVGNLLGVKEPPIKTGVLRHNVPAREAEDFKRDMKAADAVVEITEGEQRIYRAAEDAREQLDALVRNR